MHYALPTRQVEVWKEMWHVAASLHTFPIARPHEYAQSLLEISDSQSSKDDAITVLLKVCEPSSVLILVRSPFWLSLLQLEQT